MTAVAAETSVDAGICGVQHGILHGILWQQFQQSYNSIIAAGEGYQLAAGAKAALQAQPCPDNDGVWRVCMVALPVPLSVCRRL